jgi:hypothetical protein
LNSKCPRPIGPTYNLGPSTGEAMKETTYVFLIMKKYDLKRLHLNKFKCVCVPTRRVPIFRNLVYFWGNT